MIEREKLRFQFWIFPYNNLNLFQFRNANYKIEEEGKVLRLYNQMGEEYIGDDKKLVNFLCVSRILLLEAILMFSDKEIPAVAKLVYGNFI